MKNRTLLSFFVLLLPVLGQDTVPVADSDSILTELIAPGRDMKEEAKSAIMEHLAGYARELEKDPSFSQLLAGASHRLVFGTCALTSAEIEQKSDSDFFMPLEEELSSISDDCRLYYMALCNLNYNFILAVSPMVKRNFYHFLLTNEKKAFKPDEQVVPMTDIEEVEALDKLLKLPVPRLRKILEKVQLQSDEFFALDDDSRFMKLSVAIDLAVQKEACGLCSTLIPIRTLKTTSQDGIICVGIVAVSCPSFPPPDTKPISMSCPFDAADFHLRDFSWLQAPFFPQAGVRIVKNQSGKIFYLGFGQEAAPGIHSGETPSEQQMIDYENALTRAGENAKSALKIHVSAMRFFANSDNIDRLLSNYQGMGFGNYSMEYSLETCLDSLPEYLDFQNALPGNPYFLLQQIEENQDDAGKTILTVIYALPAKDSQ